jgi:hypothetical protein
VVWPFIVCCCLLICLWVNWFCVWLVIYCDTQLFVTGVCWLVRWPICFKLNCGMWSIGSFGTLVPNGTSEARPGGSYLWFLLVVISFVCKLVGDCAFLVKPVWYCCVACLYQYLTGAGSNFSQLLGFVFWMLPIWTDTTLAQFDACWTLNLLLTGLKLISLFANLLNGSLCTVIWALLAGLKLIYFAGVWGCLVLLGFWCWFNIWWVMLIFRDIGFAFAGSVGIRWCFTETCY